MGGATKTSSSVALALIHFLESKGTIRCLEALTLTRWTGRKAMTLLSAVGTTGEPRPVMPSLMAVTCLPKPSARTLSMRRSLQSVTGSTAFEGLPLRD